MKGPGTIHAKTAGMWCHKDAIFREVGAEHQHLPLKPEQDPERMISVVDGQFSPSIGLHNLLDEQCALISCKWPPASRVGMILVPWKANP